MNRKSKQDSLNLLQQMPVKLQQWIKMAVAGLWPPEMQDYYQANLEKQVWKIYQMHCSEKEALVLEKETVQESQQAETLTLEELGDAETVREQFLREIARDAEGRKAELWYAPMVLSIVFMVTGIISMVGGIICFPKMHNWHVLEEKVYSAFRTGRGWEEAAQWLFAIMRSTWQVKILFCIIGSIVAVFVCWIVAYCLKRKYDKGQRMFMKRWRNILGIMMVALLLVACNVGRSEEELYVYSLVAKDWETPMLTVEHGEDGVIQWEDAGMEAHVRLWLNKPDGEIYYSDVWDIRYITINHSVGDVVLEIPGEGEAFQLRNDRVNRPAIEGTEDWQNLPPIESLRDLRHFESLQVLTVDTIVISPLTDISGLENCPNLSVLTFSGYVKPENLEPLAELSSLEYLSLGISGTLDLAPLKELKNLTRLVIGGAEILSLEPIAELPLQCLVLNRGDSSDSGNENLDFSPLAKMKELRYLRISDIDSFGYDDCKYLTELDKLETLEIIHTAASYRANEVRRLLPQLKRFNMRLDW